MIGSHIHAGQGTGGSKLAGYIDNDLPRAHFFALGQIVDATAGLVR